MVCYGLCIYIYICVCLFICACVLIFLLLSFLSNLDMDNNDVIYYARTVHNIAGVISSLSYLRNNFDRKHVFHIYFIDENPYVLDQMKTNLK